jgi:hypothetical protein
MAILILPARDYANMLEQAVGMRSLKIRRQVEKLRAKKRAKDVTRINLTGEDASSLTAILYGALWEHFEKEELRDVLDSYVDMELGTEPPAVIYSMSEWKAVVELASGLESKINLQQFGSWNIYLNFYSIREALYPYIQRMVAIAHGMDISEIVVEPHIPEENETRYNHIEDSIERFTNGEWVKETLQEFDGANAFGVVEESEDQNANSNQADSNNA